MIDSSSAMRIRTVWGIIARTCLSLTWPRSSDRMLPESHQRSVKSNGPFWHCIRRNRRCDRKKESRGERIRTSDHRYPIPVRYRTAPRPVGPSISQGHYHSGPGNPRDHAPIGCVPASFGSVAYLISALAPASSRRALAASASSLVTPSRTAFGAASTTSLASLRPRLVSSRTALMT